MSTNLLPLAARTAALALTVVAAASGKKGFLQPLTPDACPMECTAVQCGCGPNCAACDHCNPEKANQHLDPDYGCVTGNFSVVLLGELSQTLTWSPYEDARVHFGPAGDYCSLSCFEVWGSANEDFRSYESFPVRVGSNWGDPGRLKRGAGLEHPLRSVEKGLRFFKVRAATNFYVYHDMAYSRWSNVVERPISLFEEDKRGKDSEVVFVF